MPLLRLDKISIHFGSQVLLDAVDLTVHKGTKIGLLGRNGAGKTTLMKIIAGTMAPDAGQRWLRPGVEIGWLDQSLPEPSDLSVYDMVAGALPELGELLSQYHHLISDFDQGELHKLERVQAQLEARDGWNLGQKVDTIISQLQLPTDKLMSELSGGWRRRVALACALVREPEVLFLDEPTNHLDIPAIEWLEKQLQEYRGALLLVTHDRNFLQQVVNNIVELDRGQLYQFEGDYHKFLRYRAQQLAAEERANALFDKKLAREEVWIRQGIKARRTRNEGRVRALEALRSKRSGRREIQRSASFKVDAAAASGKIVAELIKVSHGFDGVAVIKDFSTTILRGDRIGIVGANGAGKSTLLKILLGKLTPDSGTVKLGSKLEVAYFDQLRETLDLEKNLIDNVCGGQEFIEIDGKRKHAISYLGDFLFAPDRIRTPAKALSGGEQNRAILAKLFTRPANILVFDEPTNDLDIETLELLEDILLKFKGTVLLVSHDREFMDNVITSLMVFEGDARVKEYVGGYADWVAGGGRLKGLQDNELLTKTGTKKSISPQDREAHSQPGSGKPGTGAKKLSHKEQQELNALPSLIEQLETRQSEFEAQIANPDFYRQDQERIQQTLKEIADNQTDLEQAYRRWEALEG